jgi:hypothetical protein
MVSGLGMGTELSTEPQKAWYWEKSKELRLEKQMGSDWEQLTEHRKVKL